MTPEYPSDWDSRRKQVYRRDNYTCQNCGQKGGPHGDVELHAHHVVPKGKGGSHRVENLQTVCKQCHDSIHGQQLAPTADQSKAQSSQQSTGDLSETDKLSAYLAINVIVLGFSAALLSPLGSRIALVGGTVISIPVSLKIYREIRGQPGTEFAEEKQELEGALENMK